jgi:hypothetical protein
MPGPFVGSSVAPTTLATHARVSTVRHGDHTFPAHIQD